MLPCLKPPLTPPPSPKSRRRPSSPENPSSPRSSAVESPPIDLTQEFSLATQTNSYGEIQRTFGEPIEEEEPPQFLLLDQVLRPSREFVQETISTIATENSIYPLITSYFEHSEHISRLCLLLYQSVRRVRSLYKPIHNLLDDFFNEEHDSNSSSESQSTFAHDLFVKFDAQENPFLASNSQCFDELRSCFSDLSQEFDSRVRKPRSKSCPKGGLSLCLAANKAKKGEFDVAVQGMYVLRREIDTIDRVIARLNVVVENDKLLIKLGLERGMDRFHVMEILRQLRRNRSSFVERLCHVEENLFLCFVAINRARASLLREIHFVDRDG